MAEAARLIGPLDRSWLLRLLLVFGVAASAAAIDLTDTALGRALAPAFGSTLGIDGGMPARILIGIVLGVLALLNLLLLLLLPFRWQVLLMWAELLMLFLAFFVSFDLSYRFIWTRLIFLVQGAAVTVYVSLLSIFFACILALFGALARLSRSGPAFGVATFYISFFRGTPLILQVYLIYLGLPQIGLTLPAVPSGVIALSLCYGAYMAEIFRAGIEGVPHGQREAARALGLKEGLILRKIVLPQAMRLIVPPVGNQFIAMLKDSSLVSVMGVWELTFIARTAGRAEFRHLEMLITAALIYWLLSIVFEIVQSRLEAYYGKGHKR
ncbi:MAG TPA: amino acid ABC transporter permease [Alphaproteobacteria bacterium]|jgi:polar amino acid transport system permease protein|nr:amino acid ABC transporter permease [Alphaproteobacteria bacterium]